MALNARIMLFYCVFMSIRSFGFLEMAEKGGGYSPS